MKSEKIQMLNEWAELGEITYFFYKLMYSFITKPSVKKLYDICSYYEYECPYHDEKK